MDSAKLILTEAVPPPRPLEDLNKIDGASEERKKQLAKDFESVFINKLLDAMRKTIGEWGFEKDETSKQIQGIFYLYLSRDVANKGGFGMWRDIYQFLTDADQTETTSELLDKNI
jgi:Rod binding domain-containing protein